jgi:hypothetical protein
VPEAPYAPPVDEADDAENAANLRRATLASTVGSALFIRMRLRESPTFMVLVIEDALDDKHAEFVTVR